MSLIPVLSLSLVTHYAMHDEDNHYPWNLSGNLTYANVGAAMAVDTTAPATARLATTGDIIIGRLEQVEVRSVEGVTVGTIAMSGGMILPIDTTAGSVAPAIGDSVEGGVIPGTVVKLAPAQGRGNIVTGFSPDGTQAIVLFI